MGRLIQPSEGAEEPALVPKLLALLRSRERRQSDMPLGRLALLKGPRYPSSRTQQFRVLLRRFVYDQVHDRTKFLRMFAVKLMLGVLVGLCWVGQGRPAKASKAFTLTGVLFTCINN